MPIRPHTLAEMMEVAEYVQGLEGRIQELELERGHPDLLTQLEESLDGIRNSDEGAQERAVRSVKAITLVNKIAKELEDIRVQIMVHGLGISEDVIRTKGDDAAKDYIAANLDELRQRYEAIEATSPIDRNSPVLAIYKDAKALRDSLPDGRKRDEVTAFMVQLGEDEFGLIPPPE